MSVLQLSKYYPPTHGGVETVAEFFSRALCESGFKTSILSFGNSNKNYKGQFGEDVFQTDETLKLGSSSFSMNYLLGFRDLIKRRDVKMILLHLPNPLSHEIIKWFHPIVKEKKIKVFGVYHSDIINQVHLRDAYNLYFLKDLNLYDGFICSSNNLKTSSSILSRIDDKKIKIIPFCVDAQTSQIRKYSSVPEFKGKFLALGRMVPYKGFDFLIDSFKGLPYELSIVGGGPLKEKLTQMAPSNVKFFGEVNEEEKFKLFVEHDALIVSSINRSEAYGMTIVEAFSVGVPVIASDIDTGVSFLVQEGKTGFRFPIKDKQALRDKLQFVANNPRLLQEVSSECRKFYESHLSFEQFSRSVNQLMNDTC